jgi:hypothetical protein
MPRRDGTPVALRGSGEDPEDGPLPESALTWKVLLHHATHIHEHSSATGSRASFLPATDHDADSYYEIRLTVTDSGGLEHTMAVDVQPRTSELTLASSPAGAPLEYIGGQSGPAPFTSLAAVGYRATVRAAATFVRDGVTYRFAGWSDGGERQHELAIPEEDSTRTASYVAEAGEPPPAPPGPAPPGTAPADPDPGPPGAGQAAPEGPADRPRAPGGRVTPDRAPPVLRRLAVSHRARGRLRSGTRRARGRSLRVNYRLSEAARVGLRLQRAVRRRGCARRCLRWSNFGGRVRRAGRRGANRFRLIIRGARPGRYRLSAYARDRAGNRSAIRRVRFRLPSRR